MNNINNLQFTSTLLSSLRADCRVDIREAEDFLPRYNCIQFNIKNKLKTRVIDYFSNYI